MEEAFKLYNPQTWATLLVFLGFVGTGIFFYKRFWPWYTEYKNKQQQLDHDLETQRLQLEADSDRRWQETTTRQTQVFASFTAEIAVLNSRINAVVEGINRLYRVIDGQNHTGS
jgi:hypothetical protein